MKKTNLIKMVTILLISMAVILFSTIVNAADNDTGFNDLTSTLSNTNNSSSNTNSSSNSNNTNNNTNTNTNNANTNNTNKTNNSSVYNNTNTDLPKTGIEDSIPVAMLTVVFGISAVYAYRKIKEYRNI